jgi:hypothetical protein
VEGLAADRFEAGWSVYAPADIDDGDPMAFLDMPVGRSVFLVGDSGRIEEVSASVPPEEARLRFAASEGRLPASTAWARPSPGETTPPPRQDTTGQHHRDVIGLDAAATAAYRRVHDRLDLEQLDLYADDMFE